MTDSERWASWTLAVVSLTTIAYFVLLALRGNGPKTLPAFALLAFASVPKSSRRHFLISLL